jgi:hypothetical protein
MITNDGIVNAAACFLQASQTSKTVLASGMATGQVVTVARSRGLFDYFAAGRPTHVIGIGFESQAPDGKVFASQVNQTRLDL